MTLTSGTKLGRYEIRSKIGEGEWRSVFVTKDETLPQCNRVETDDTSLTVA